MANGDVKQDPARLGKPESEPTPERAAPEPAAREPRAPGPEDAAGPAPPGPDAAPSVAETPPPAGSEPRPEPAAPVEPGPPRAEPEAPAEAAPPSEPEPAPPSEPEPAPPVDETEDLIRVGQVGSGRRLSPVDEDTLRSIRSFARDRPLPGIGTLLDLARAHATSGRGPGLGVDVFSELRSQLGRLVADLESVAIHAGPVLFLKTRAKNQPGTALRWLSEEERRGLREHPELLDHPGRLPANLKKLLAGSEED